MKVLSDANRVKRVKLLQHTVMGVCEIQAVLEPATSTAIKHLKLLEEAGLIVYTIRASSGMAAWGTSAKSYQ